MSIEQRQTDAWLLSGSKANEDRYMGRAYDYDAPQVEAWAAWTLQAPPDSPDNDVQLGVGACDTVPAAHGQHSAHDAAADAASDELLADLWLATKHTRPRFSRLFRDAYNEILRLRGLG